MKRKHFLKNHGTLKILLSAIAVPIVIYLLIFFSLGGFGEVRGKGLFQQPPDSTILFAHRGIAAYYPENSTGSIDEARRAGFTAVEFDLRKSADGEFILFHDVDCKRMLGAEIAVRDIPAKELKRFPLLQNGENSSFYVPTLKEVLDRYHTDFIFYLDMKLSGFNDADQIAEIIQNYRIENSSVVASADLLFILYIEYRYPQINTALEGYNAGKEWTYKLIPKNLKPDYLSGFLSRVNEDHLVWLKKNGLLSRRIVYGVDSTNYLAAKAMGLRNLILDYDTTSVVFNDIGSGNP
ncbi:MAG: glycerophosphodiester phosphodiesterase [Bacteroidota bacterium]